MRNSLSSPGTHVVGWILGGDGMLQVPLTKSASRNNWEFLNTSGHPIHTDQLFPIVINRSNRQGIGHPSCYPKATMVWPFPLLVRGFMGHIGDYGTSNLVTQTPNPTVLIPLLSPLGHSVHLILPGFKHLQAHCQLCMVILCVYYVGGERVLT
jgi:hypothetical protein